MPGPSSKTLLILEDDQRLARSIAREFEDHGYLVTLAASIREIPERDFAFALVDLRLGGEFGLDAIGRIKGFAPDCRTVVLSGYGSITTAVEALKRGAVDYLTKPAAFAQLEAALRGTRTSPTGEFRSPSLSQVEHDYIDFVLVKNEGNISKTARALGLHRQSLQRKLKKYT